MSTELSRGNAGEEGGWGCAYAAKRSGRGSAEDSELGSMKGREGELGSKGMSFKTTAGSVLEASDATSGGEDGGGSDDSDEDDWAIAAALRLLMMSV